MADNFFFKGRQVPGQDQGKSGFTNKADHKMGSKKYPLKLVVTSEARQQEVEAMLDEAKLHADIILDSEEGAVESIAELTTLLNKASTVTLEKTPARNDPCSCGSGKKYKKCCG